MKITICFVAVAIFMSSQVFAQKVNTPKKSSYKKAVNKYPVKGKPVTVNSWGSLSVYMLPGYFKDDKAGIIKQIGIKEFEQMESYCTEQYWHKTFAANFNETYSTEKAAQLKMYCIAQFVHQFNGTKFEPMVLIRIPVAENKNMYASDDDRDAYIILKKKDVVIQ